MRFYDQLRQLDFDALRAAIEAATPADVERLLTSDAIADADLPILFSSAADAYLEHLAARSAAVTERRFGKVIQLYAPLYLSSECVNKCTYCGFSMELDIPRVTLTPDHVRRDADILHDEGFRHILLVSGEHRRIVNMNYLIECVRALGDRFASVAIEVQPLKTDEYRRLADAGVDGLALYQEVYDPALYARYHLTGPKKNHENRVDAIECGGEAGMRSLGIATLLGLAPWRTEAVLLALHGRWLQRKFWRSKIAVSFPRIQPSAHRYDPDFRVSDRDLTHMLCATRLALPDAELVVSTREPARLRDGLVGLGVTRMSAGSRTNPGGYSAPESHDSEQFTIDDDRPPAAVAAMIAARGHEPVWKDFDRRLVTMDARDRR
jgi:2-iminoacetate synthase